MEEDTGNKVIEKLSRNFKANSRRMQGKEWKIWIWIVILALFVGIVLSSAYYEQKAKSEMTRVMGEFTDRYDDLCDFGRLPEDSDIKKAIEKYSKE